jgi:hypothetical protein
VKINLLIYKLVINQLSIALQELFTEGSGYVVSSHVNMHGNVMCKKHKLEYQDSLAIPTNSYKTQKIRYYHSCSLGNR